MYFWNVNGLADDFRADKVTEREKMKYLVAYMAYQSLHVQNALWTWEVVNSVTIAKAVVVAALNIAGVIFCYEMNRRGDNREFLDRFVCLTWPITVILLIILFAGTGLAAVLASYFRVGIGTVLGNLAQGEVREVFVVTVAALVVYYVWLAIKIKGVAQAGKT